MDEEVPKIPNLELTRKAFLLTLSDALVSNKAAVQEELLKEIDQNNMAPYYTYLCEKLKWPVDQSKLAKWSAAIEEQLKKLEATIEDATANLGENEIREAHLAKANFLASVGEKEKAVSAFRVTFDKTTALGQKLDIQFILIRIGFFFDDGELVKTSIEKTKTMVEAGGDWDRRNRLKVYEAVYLMSIRNFKRAAELFVETLSTFTSLELFSYKEFIWYAVMLNVYSLDRVALKKKVLHAPEILTVLEDIPHLADYLNSLYNSNYALFFSSLAYQVDRVKLDVHLAPHARFYVREMRIKAYAQLLESYRSVQLAAMAASFGVTVDFLDIELSRFIAAGRLHCKIDKVGGVVETTRPDSKNALYQATIRDGDLLLNRVQKLSRVINL